MKKIVFTLALLVPVLALADDPADKSGTSNRADKFALTAKDTETLAKLHQINLMEEQVGKLAKKNGSAKKVKSFGDVLIKDHTLADKQIQDYAKNEKVDLTAPTPKDDAERAEQQADADMMSRMETMKGDEFDAEFAKMMVEGHQKAIDLVEGTLTSTQDTGMHALLNKVLPVLKEHLRLAQDISKTVKSS